MSRRKPIHGRPKPKRADLFQEDEGTEEAEDTLKSQYAGIDSDEEEEFVGKRRPKKASKGYFSGIRWTHVALLFMLTGTAILPVVVFMAEHAAGALVSVVPSGLGTFGEAWGLTKTPKNRLKAFYEKHNPEKVGEIDVLLGKYRGDYKSMIKKLEAKYGDYGFFIGWEKENDFAAIQKKTFDYVYKHGNKYYQRYVPFPVRTGFRNIYYNVYNLVSKGYKTIDGLINPKPSKSKSKRRSSSKPR